MTGLRKLRLSGDNCDRITETVTGVTESVTAVTVAVTITSRCRNTSHSYRRNHHSTAQHSTAVTVNQATAVTVNQITTVTPQHPVTPQTMTGSRKLRLSGDNCDGITTTVTGVTESVTAVTVAVTITSRCRNTSHSRCRNHHIAYSPRIRHVFAGLPYSTHSWIHRVFTASDY